MTLKIKIEGIKEYSLLVRVSWFVEKKVKEMIRGEFKEGAEE